MKMTMKMKMKMIKKKKNFYNKYFSGNLANIESSSIGKLMKNLKEKGILNLFDDLKKKKGKIDIEKLRKLKAELKKIIN